MVAAQTLRNFARLLVQVCMVMLIGEPLPFPTMEDGKPNDPPSLVLPMALCIEKPPPPVPP